MTFYPRNQRLFESPNRVSSSFPLYIGCPKLSRHYPLHRHDYLEVSYVISGEGYQNINGKKCPMTPGTCSFLLPYQIHELFNITPQLQLINIEFDPDFLFQSSGTNPGLKDLLFSKEELPSYIQVEGSQQVMMNAILQNILEEFTHQELWRNELIKLKLSEFLIHFDRLRRHDNALQNLDETRSTKSIWTIVHYIHTHYGEEITLTSLADQFGVNRSYLSSEFKKHLGLNLVSFLHEVRIRHACSLLASTNMSVYDVAIEAGFGSFKSFSRNFRQLKEITPSEYRKRFQLEDPLAE